MDHWLALIQATTTIPASQQAGSAVGETLDTWIGIVQKLLTILAILVGAFIALVKFQLLNPLTRRLEPEITSGSVGVHKGKVYLHAQATVRNTELLPVTIGPDYTGLRLWVFRNETHDWERVETYGVFEEKIRLGANSVVGQPLWIVRPKSDVLAYRLELLIGSVDQTVWRAVAIVNLVAEVHNKE